MPPKKSSGLGAAL
jgi:hypothetical protein